MYRILTLLFLILFLASCKNSEKKTDTTETSVEKVKNTATACPFDNPDTSLSKIELRNSASAKAVLQVEELLGDTAYLFYSADKKQLLETRVFPGDGINQVSIFKVREAAATSENADATGISEFSSEKGIKLGLSKAELTALLGNCYTSSDSTATGITLAYRIESPQDSRTGFLKKWNMPVYYGVYKFSNDKLAEFEFGFEYP